MTLLGSEHLLSLPCLYFITLLHMDKISLEEIIVRNLGFQIYLSGNKYKYYGVLNINNRYHNGTYIFILFQQSSIFFQHTTPYKVEQEKNKPKRLLDAIDYCYSNQSLGRIQKKSYLTWKHLFKYHIYVCTVSSLGVV